MPVERYRKLKDGTEVLQYLVYYVNAEGKRTSKSFDKKAKALAFEKTIKSDAATKKPPITRGRYTYADIIEKYIVDSMVGRDGGSPWRSATIRRARDNARVMRQFLPDDTLLRNLTPTLIRDVRTKLQQSDYSRATIIGCFKQMKAALNHAVMEELIEYNPAAVIRIKQPKVVSKDEDEFQCFTKAQVQAILQTAQASKDSEDGRTRAAYAGTWLIPHVLVETGLRSSELLGLTWENVDLAEGEIRVRQTLEKNTNQIEDVKTAGSRRTLIISQGLCCRLEMHRDLHPNAEFVFENRKGGHLQYRNALRWWHELLERSGVEPIGFHAARHYYASRLIEAGVDAKVLTTNMGHHDPAFTLRVYGHLFDDRDTRDKKRAVAETLSAFAA